MERGGAYYEIWLPKGGLERTFTENLQTDTV